MSSAPHEDFLAQDKTAQALMGMMMTFGGQTICWTISMMSLNRDVMMTANLMIAV